MAEYDFKFNIGDMVTIEDSGQVFGSFDEMAKKMKLQKWNMGNDYHIFGSTLKTRFPEIKGEIVARELFIREAGSRFAETYKLYGVRIKERDIIMAEDGLGIIKPILSKLCIFYRTIEEGVKVC